MGLIILLLVFRKSNVIKIH